MEALSTRPMMDGERAAGMIEHDSQSGMALEHPAANDQRSREPGVIQVADGVAKTVSGKHS